MWTEFSKPMKNRISLSNFQQQGAVSTPDLKVQREGAMVANKSIAEGGGPCTSVGALGKNPQSTRGC